MIGFKLKIRNFAVKPHVLGVLTGDITEFVVCGVPSTHESGPIGVRQIRSKQRFTKAQDIPNPLASGPSAQFLHAMNIGDRGHDNFDVWAENDEAMNGIGNRLAESGQPFLVIAAPGTDVIRADK